MHQKFTKYQEQFLDQKFESLFAPYPYIFILQHNSITASEWKKIKKALPSETALHVVPKKTQHVISRTSLGSGGYPGLSGTTLPGKSTMPRDLKGSKFQKQFSAPLSFFGCYSPLEIKLLLKTLEDIKLPKYALFSLGLFIKNSELGVASQCKTTEDTYGSEATCKSQFCNFLEIEQIITDIEKQIALLGSAVASNHEALEGFASPQDKNLRATKSVFINLLNVLQPSHLPQTLESHSIATISIIEAANLRSMVVDGGRSLP